MRKGRNGEKKKREKKREKNGGEKRKRLKIIVATTSLPAVDRPNTDRWNAVPTHPHNKELDEIIKEK